MTLPRHDFTRPTPVSPRLRTGLSLWLSRSNKLLAELLAAMSVEVEVRFEDVVSVMPGETLADWSERSLAFVTAAEGQEAPAVVALPNLLVQDLVCRLLGEAPSKLAGERDLTTGERSVAELIGELIVRSLNETWQGDPSSRLLPGEIEPNLRRTRRFPPTESIVVCRSTVKTSVSQSHWCWMLTHDCLAHLFGLPLRSKKAGNDPNNRRQLERLIREMHAEVEIRLGGVQLSGPQLAALRVGDVVVLDQRVGEPLQGSIRGEPKFLGWAGRVGNRQAFEIEAALQPRRRNDESDAA